MSECLVTGFVTTDGPVVRSGQTGRRSPLAEKENPDERDRRRGQSRDHIRRLKPAMDIDRLPVSSLYAGRIRDGFAVAWPPL